MSDESATSSMRGTCVVFLIVGIVLCVTPLLPMGILWTVASAIVLLCSPVAEMAENQTRVVTRQEARQDEGHGGGCAAVLLACMLVLAIVVIAVAAGLAAAGGMR